MQCFGQSNQRWWPAANGKRLPRSHEHVNSPSAAPRTQRSGERTVRHESSRALCSHRTQTSPPTSPTAALSVCPLRKVVRCAPSPTRQCDSCSGPRAPKTDNTDTECTRACELIHSFIHSSTQESAPHAVHSTRARVTRHYVSPCFGLRGNGCPRHVPVVLPVCAPAGPNFGYAAATLDPYTCASQCASFCSLHTHSIAFKR